MVRPLSFPDWVRQATESEIGHRVRFLGGVPEADKPLLYRAATAFVFPSRYEDSAWIR